MLRPAVQTAQNVKIDVNQDKAADKEKKHSELIILKNTPKFDYHLQQTEAKWVCHQLLCKNQNSFISNCRLKAERKHRVRSFLSQQKGARPSSGGVKSLRRDGLVSEYVTALWFRARWQKSVH